MVPARVTKAAASFGCLAPAWLFGWVAAIFLPGALMAATGAAPALAGANVLQETWRIADEIGPFAKLAMGGLLAAGFFAASRVRASLVIDMALAAVAACVAVAVALAVLPEDLSTGFGVGLTGQRFDPALLPYYAAGAVAAGVVFALSARLCAKRRTQ